MEQEAPIRTGGRNLKECASLRRECANLMSLIKAIVGKEANIKNKVRAGREKSMRMIHSLRHRKGARAALFFVAERVGSHTCAFSNAQGAQVCAKRKPDEPHKSHSVERSKNKE